MWSAPPSWSQREMLEAMDAANQPKPRGPYNKACGLMFDLQKWRGWLQEAAGHLRDQGLAVKFTKGPYDTPKPGMSIGGNGQNAMGTLETWITGETDWTIMAPPSTSAKMVSHKWMLILTDETFEEAFADFM